MIIPQNTMPRGKERKTNKNMLSEFWKHNINPITGFKTPKITKSSSLIETKRTSIEMIKILNNQE